MGDRGWAVASFGYANDNEENSNKEAHTAYIFRATFHMIYWKMSVIAIYLQQLVCIRHDTDYYEIHLELLTSDLHMIKMFCPFSEAFPFYSHFSFFPSSSFGRFAGAKMNAAGTRTHAFVNLKVTE